MGRPEEDKKDLTEYTLEYSAFGMYVSVDGHWVDEYKIGSHFYRKEQVDALVKSMEKRIKKINKHLKDLRQKYSTLRQLRADALGNCKELLTILEGK